MSEIQLRNKYFLNILDGFVEELLSKENYNDPKYYAYSSPEDMTKGEYYCSEKYLTECLSRDTLVGVPDRHFAQPISKMKRADPEKWEEYMHKVKFDFAAELGAHTSALLSYYPPGGFVGWRIVSAPSQPSRGTRVASRGALRPPVEAESRATP